MDDETARVRIKSAIRTGRWGQANPSICTGESNRAKIKHTTIEHGRKPQHELVCHVYISAEFQEEKYHNISSIPVQRQSLNNQHIKWDYQTQVATQNRIAWNSTQLFVVPLPPLHSPKYKAVDLYCALSLCVSSVHSHCWFGFCLHSVPYFRQFAVWYCFILFYLVFILVENSAWTAVTAATLLYLSSLFQYFYYSSIALSQTLRRLPIGKRFIYRIVVWQFSDYLSTDVR